MGPGNRTHRPALSGLVQSSLISGNSAEQQRSHQVRQVGGDGGPLIPREWRVAQLH